MNGSRKDRWLDAKMTGPDAGMFSRPMRERRKYRWKNGCRIARETQYTIGLTPRSRARACRRSSSLLARSISSRRLVSPTSKRYPRTRASLQWSGVAFDRTRTLRGALAGAAAAAVWLAQQPLDKRIFGWPHDDAELLAQLTGTSHAVGTVLHVSNGALFGGVYAHVAPAAPLAPQRRGPLAGLPEHVATWPLTALAAPAMTASPRAFAQ